MTTHKKILAIYKRRQNAHDELLACDIEMDKILKELTGYKSLYGSVCSMPTTLAELMGLEEISK